MPTTDAMKVQTVVMIRYAPHWDPESVSCTMKTHKTFTAVDKIITGIMLPRKIQVRLLKKSSVSEAYFFFFFRKSGCSTVYAHGNIHQNAERKRVAVHVDLSVSDGSVQYFHKKSKSEGKDRHDDKVFAHESSHFHFCDGR